MRFAVLLVALLPLALGAKELLGEELPSKEYHENDLVEDGSKQTTDEDAALVKRSVSNIATRRRSAIDKNFMRFGRSDPAMAVDKDRRSKQDFMRFGRANNMMRFGRANNMMRFGRANNMMRFGRANNMMRFGRANNMMRFGRANNMMRFGRANNMMRFGRDASNAAADDYNDLDYSSDARDEARQRAAFAAYLGERAFGGEDEDDDEETTESPEDGPADASPLEAMFSRQQLEGSRRKRQA